MANEMKQMELGGSVTVTHRGRVRMVTCANGCGRRARLAHRNGGGYSAAARGWQRQGVIWFGNRGHGLHVCPECRGQTLDVPGHAKALLAGFAAILMMVQS